MSDKFAGKIAVIKPGKVAKFVAKRGNWSAGQAGGSPGRRVAEFAVESEPQRDRPTAQAVLLRRAQLPPISSARRSPSTPCVPRTFTIPRPP